MAGKFVSIEEAARLLGVSVDEVNRLVDRKKLFPMRDGASSKFKIEEIERVAASLGDDSSRSESLSLDLDLPTPGADDLALGDAIDIGDMPSGNTDAGSQTIVRGGAAGGGGDLSGLALDDDADDTASDSADLALESIIGASSLARPAAGSGSLIGSSPAADEPLTFDLSNVAAGVGSGSLAGSQATGLGASGGGSGFSVPADSGLSLEDGGLAVSGINLDAGPMPGSGISEAGGSLAGDAFELGADGADEDSASVVIATEESGDSSFFGQVNDDSASVQFGDSSVTDSTSSSMLGEPFAVPAADMTFSAWQIAGLTCCALVLLAGGFIMYDLAWTIRQPQGAPVTAPLLNALSEAFGWRR
jgi:excisionase family DNA binding protein